MLKNDFVIYNFTIQYFITVQFDHLIENIPSSSTFSVIWLTSDEGLTSIPHTPVLSNLQSFVIIKKSYKLHRISDGLVDSYLT